MNKMTKAIKNERKATTEHATVNFMGGVSYEWDPIDTLKMVTASSIFGEPQYYRDGEFAEKGIKDGVFEINTYFADYIVSEFDKYEGMKTSDIMEKVIDDALKYNFEETINWAITLRNEYNMRLNPQVIMVRASMMTDERIKFTEKNPGKFSEINNKVMSRADDVLSQITYYIYKNGSKNNIPGILKKSWKKKIESLSDYEIYKYRNHGIGLIDAVRISHANNKSIDTLMRTGTIEIDESNKTWETLKASGKNWNEITDEIRMPHMALLRNLRGIFKEVTDDKKTDELLNSLIAGVEKGKQFPFRYMSALNAVQAEANRSDNLSEIFPKIYDCLEECLDKSCENLPHLSGNNAFLSDNSGSAWGTFNSEYGTVTVANIDNLSATIGAKNSDKGTVFKFGDKLVPYQILKSQGILSQTKKVDRDGSGNVGGGTENGVWLFFKDAIDNKKVYDNIFIYSDMQAGHGGLYGTKSDAEEYAERGFSINAKYCEKYIDVAKLANEYRQKVNPKVNLYCIQTAGYNNVLLPENGYRTNILYGWTGKELLYADAINKFWDEKDRQKELNVEKAKQNKNVEEER